MREILFRGKRYCNGKWVEGSLLAWPDGSAEICYDNPENDDEFLKSIVYPETVGQFTGLTDKNGKKIFEGDIVKAAEKEDKNLVGAVEWKFECWTVSGANWADTLHMANYLHKLEVIGNIHDNPEFLEA